MTGGFGVFFCFRFLTTRMMVGYESMGCAWLLFLRGVNPLFFGYVNIAST